MNVDQVVDKVLSLFKGSTTMIAVEQNLARALVQNSVKTVLVQFSTVGLTEMLLKLLLCDMNGAFGTLATVFTLHKSLFDLSFPSVGRAFLGANVEHVIQVYTWVGQANSITVEVIES